MESEFDFTLAPKFSIEASNFGDYFGIWSMHVPTFEAIVERLNGVNLHMHMQSGAPAIAVQKQQDRDFTLTTDGIALLSITGPMMKTVASMADGTSTVRARQIIRAAKNDPEVVGAILKMDTPGGTVKGNRDLADDVAAFAAVKPIFQFTEDMTASAGVSIASQATKRFANNETALYGAMGTYSVLVDKSGMAEKLGVKVHTIKAGDFKGMGTEGSEITAEQLAEAQRIVNALNESYLQVIASGLGKPLEMVRALADGRVHTAGDALGMGLIDGIQSFEETYRQLVAVVPKKGSGQKKSAGAITQQSGERSMDKVAVTLAELKSSFPGSTADWRETQLEAGASLPEAALAYAKHVETKAAADREAHAKEIAALKTESEAKIKAAGVSLGHSALTEGPKGKAKEGEELNETGDPVEDFNAEVAKIAGPSPNMARRQAAVRQVANKKPDLYESYLLATNTGKKTARLIMEKLETVKS